MLRVEEWDTSPDLLDGLIMEAVIKVGDFIEEAAMSFWEVPRINDIALMIQEVQESEDLTGYIHVIGETQINSSDSQELPSKEQNSVRVKTMVVRTSLKVTVIVIDTTIVPMAWSVVSTIVTKEEDLHLIKLMIVATEKENKVHTQDLELWCVTAKTVVVETLLKVTVIVIDTAIVLMA